MQGLLFQLLALLLPGFAAGLVFDRGGDLIDALGQDIGGHALGVGAQLEDQLAVDGLHQGAVGFAARRHEAGRLLLRGATLGEGGLAECFLDGGQVGGPVRPDAVKGNVLQHFAILR